MAAVMTEQGGIIRVELPVRWAPRLLSLPSLAGAAYLLWNVALRLKQDLSGLGRLSEDWAGLLMFAGLGLAIGIPGLLAVTSRYYVVVDKNERKLVPTTQLGPFVIRRPRRLVDYHLISITDDGDQGAVTYDVNLCGNKWIKPVMVSSFSKREEADALARQLGAALKLPVRDLVGTEPDED